MHAVVSKLMEWEGGKGRVVDEWMDGWMDASLLCS